MSIALTEGTVLAGRYRLERLLGEGGMGVVWAATHTVTLRKVAIKFLKISPLEHPDARARFLREARAASVVDHPNVVAVHDVFELEDGLPVMIMDLLDGETLAQLLARQKQLSVAEISSIVLPVLAAVGAAHEAGIVHRDLKPDNIFLLRDADPATRVRVVDFGIAKLLSGDEAANCGVVTDTGSMIGTPYYMAPEQAFGEKDIDQRVDVWALGVILFEAIAGRRPVEGDNIGQVLRLLVSEPMPLLSDEAPSTPGDVVELVRRMLTRSRDDRPRDLREAAEVLGRYAKVPVRFPKRWSEEARAPISTLEGGATVPAVTPSSKDLRVATPSGDRGPESASATGTGQALTVSRSAGRRSTYAMIALGLGVLGVAGWVMLTRPPTSTPSPPASAPSGAAIAPSASQTVTSPRSSGSAESAASTPLPGGVDSRAPAHHTAGPRPPPSHGPSARASAPQPAGSPGQPGLVEAVPF